MTRTYVGSGPYFEEHYKFSSAKPKGTLCWLTEFPVLKLYFSSPIHMEQLSLGEVGLRFSF